jgi:hypothetical protein
MLKPRLLVLVFASWSWSWTCPPLLHAFKLPLRWLRLAFLNSLAVAVAVACVEVATRENSMVFGCLVIGVWCLGVLLIANKPEMKTKKAQICGRIVPPNQIHQSTYVSRARA